MNPLQRAWYRRRLRDPAFGSLFDPPPADEWISIDCETTGLDRERDDIVSIGAVRICGHRILSSERLDLMVRPEATRAPMGADSVRIHQLREADLATHGLPTLEVARRALAFIGSRPLVGYYLEFDVAMLNRLVQPLIGIPLPNKQIEVSGMYHDLKYAQQPDSHIDLRLNTLMTDLALPERKAHNPVNDATMAALAFIKLKALLGR
ncbi:MAG: DNA polymerase III subunit epsilon [Polaromonas sp.]|nr:DNA polymerase III subunit epsilon [Polaromonas sp.]